MSELTAHVPGREHHHRVVYKLTCAEYSSLRARADGRCEICGTPEAETGGKRLVIDHYDGSSRSGVYFVRGLLCDRCNGVMCCMDGRKPVSDHARRLRAEALSYVAASWQQPSAADLAVMAAQAWPGTPAPLAATLAAYRPTS